MSRLTLSGNVVVLSLLFNTIAWAATIDFEIPVVPVSDRIVLNPYVDVTTGVVFTAEPLGRTGVVGLARNRGRGTSACVPPESNNQSLATGPASHGVGFGGFPIRADFLDVPTPVSQVSVVFQSLADTVLRLRLFDTNDNLAGMTTALAGPAIDGMCSPNIGPPRATTPVYAVAQAPAAYAIMDVVATPNRVFVIDDFTIDSVPEPSVGIMLVAAILSLSSCYRRIRVRFDPV